MKYFNTENSSRKRKILSTFFMIFLLASYALVVFAVPPSGGYGPGDTLDPDCTPGAIDCQVQAVTLDFDSPLVESGGTVSLPAASAGVDGYLSASDWNSFNDKQDAPTGTGTSAEYLRGDNTWQTLDTSAVPENGNLYWTSGRFSTALTAATSAANLATIGTITSGVWHGSQITDAYVSDGITVSNYIPLSQKGTANGVATLDSGGKVPSSQLSSFSLSDTFVVNSEVEMLALITAELGDVAIRLDENKSYILTTNDPTNVANWQQIITPLDFVLSVNGQTGAVNLTTTDIPEGTNLYYTDTRVDDYLNTVKGVANGVASLGPDGKVPSSQLGTIILNETHVVTAVVDMLALVGVVNGDLAIVTDTSQTYVLADDNDPSNINSWVEIVNGSPVTSVNGQVGTVSLTTTNIAEGSNQYFTNARARSALSATGPLTYNSTSGVFGITQANGITNGYLSAVDWNTFDDKQDALTFGNLTASSNPEITITGGTGAVIGSGLDITIPDASLLSRGLITTGTQNLTGIKTFASGVGVGDSTPSELFSVGLGGLFQVDDTGDIVKIKNIAYTWPGTQGDTGSVLVNSDGAGTLTWGSNGVTSLNGLTDATQTFATSATGSDFTISSSGGIHTFNFPTASASARGAVTATKYTEFNNKPMVDTTYNNIYVSSISGGGALSGAGGGTNNIIMGYQAGDTLSTGSNNTLLGYQAGKSVTTGVSNAIFIGRLAGSGATSASFANFQGRSAGQNATGASYGVFIGDNAGNAASSSSQAVFIGRNAGFEATTAPYSTFIGTSAGYQASGSTESVFLGYAAGYTAVDADYSNFIGRGAGVSNLGTSAASYSNFIGYQAGYDADNAANSIFIGKNAGYADTVNNTVSGSSIAIGESAGTGGFSNSIAIGASAVNTAVNQFLIGSTYTDFNVRGINYTWPDAQAAGSGYALVNNGSGTLSWAASLSMAGSSGDLLYNNSGAIGGTTGVAFDGTNLDAKDSVFRIVDNADTTRRAIFEVGGIDAATTRTFTLPNYGGTFALATGISGGQTIYGGTASGNNLTLGSTSNVTKGKILFGTSAYDEVNNRLGIGTTSPAYTLDVIGSINVPSDQYVRFGGASNSNISYISSQHRLSIDPGSGNYASVLQQLDTGFYILNPSFKAQFSLSTPAADRHTIVFGGYYQSGYGSNNSQYAAIEQNAGKMYISANNNTSSTPNVILTLDGSNSNVGVGQTSPTAVLHLRAGTATASTAPLKFTSGTNLTTAEAGAMEYNGQFYLTTTSGRIRMDFGQDSFGNLRQVGTNGSGLNSNTYNNYLMGINAGNAITNGGQRNFIAGTDALGYYGNSATNQYDNVAIGYEVMRQPLGVAGNIAMGYQAMRGAYQISATENIALGTQAGYAMSSASANILLGYYTGKAITSAVGNIYIGANTAPLATGSKNVGIGYSLEMQNSSADGQLSIQNAIFGTGNTGTGTTASTGNIGIYVPAPSARLHLPGGTATASTAPLKFTSGTNLTTAEAGAIEYNGTSFFGTPASTRYNFLMNNYGLSGGQTVVGGTAASDTLTLSSTSNATKGKILFGTSGYDEANDRLGIGTTSPGYSLNVGGTTVTQGGYGGANALIKTLVSDTTSGKYTQLAIQGPSNGGAAVQFYNGSGVATMDFGANYAGSELGFVNRMTNGTITFWAADSLGSLNERVRIIGNGSVGIGITNPTAWLHIKAGTATAGTAPLKFTSGTSLTSAEAGAMEYNGSSLMFTPTGTLRSGILMTDEVRYNTLTQSMKGATAFTTGQFNTVIGLNAGDAITTGSNNFIVGYYAGQNTSASIANDNFFGYQAGTNATNASFSNFMNYQAGYGATSVTQSNFFGYRAGYNATDATYSNFFGGQAGSGATGATTSNFFGLNAGSGATGAYSSNFFGGGAGYNATGAYQSNFFGINTGSAATGAFYSNFIGFQAGENASNATYANFFGVNTGKNATNAQNSIFIGQGAGFSATNASNSIFIGQNAGLNDTVSNYDATPYASTPTFAGVGLDDLTANGSGYTGVIPIFFEMVIDSTGTPDTFYWQDDQGGSGSTVAITGAAQTLSHGVTITFGATTGHTQDDYWSFYAYPTNPSNKSILIGDNASTGGYSNSIALGNAATNTAVKQFMIGSATGPIDSTRIEGSSSTQCTITTGTGIACTSDERLKTNITDLTPNTLEKLLNVKTITYNWKQNPSSPTQIGFLAQDLEKYFPELVATDSAGYKSVYYAQMTPLLVESIREMNLKIVEINNTDTPNTWRDALIAWFANTANGITEFFSKRVSTEELCVKDASGQTCITRSQLDAILNGQNIPSSGGLGDSGSNDVTPSGDSGPGDTGGGSTETPPTDTPPADIPPTDPSSNDSGPSATSSNDSGPSATSSNDSGPSAPTDTGTGTDTPPPADNPSPDPAPTVDPEPAPTPDPAPTPEPAPTTDPGV